MTIAQRSSSKEVKAILTLLAEATEETASEEIVEAQCAMIARMALDAYYQEYVSNRHCTANISYLEEKDLSPTYQHIPNEWKGKVKLRTIVAGKVELPGQGNYSG